MLQNADDIRAEAADTKKRAKDLKVEAQNHAEDVQDAENVLRTIQEQAAEDERLAREVRQN